MADGFRRHAAKMARLGETDSVPFEDKDIWLHFFRLGSGSHWMAAESNGRGLFFGCVVLDGDFNNAEWRFFTTAEMWGVPGMMVLCREAVKRCGDVVAEVGDGDIMGEYS